jgi:hypothetical protein
MKVMACYVSVRFRLVLLSATALAAGAGCGRAPDTAYGASRGASLNGTGALAALYRRHGHEVRTAWRLTDELAGWADFIVRFAAIPGPVPEDEAQWYGEWLDAGTGRALVYVVRDYDAQADYWSLVLEATTGGSEADAELRLEAESKRGQALDWVARLPARADKPADADVWFAVAPAVNPPATCKSLGGPWAEDIDAKAAAVSVHEPLKAGQERVLLTGDGHVLAMDWGDENGAVLVVASGSFLLNLPLVNPARRPLAERVVEWSGDAHRRVAFVDGPSVLGYPEDPPTLPELIIRIVSFRWVAIHFAIFGVVACLALAPRLGRARPEPPSDADRPAAHAEALGSLLARSRAADTARVLLATYRRWRFPRTPHEQGGARASTGLDGRSPQPPQQSSSSR